MKRLLALGAFALSLASVGLAATPAVAAADALFICTYPGYATQWEVPSGLVAHYRSDGWTCVRNK